MASIVSVHEDGSLLSRIDRWLFRIEGWLALVSGLAIFSLMVLAVISVGGRNFFNQPLPGYVDWIEQAMPLIAFTGIAFVQRLGGHIRMDIVIGLMRGRVLWLAELVTTAAILLLILIMVYGSFAHFQRSFDLGAPMWSRDSSMDIGLPIWPGKLLVPVAFSVMALRLMLQCWGYWRAFVTNAEQPVAVPLPEDVAAQAAREAAPVSDAPAKGDG